MKILTRESAIDAIKKIESVKWDDEAAHYMEDELREDFVLRLCAVADLKHKT